MRLLVLYVRSRSVPVALAIAVTSIAVLWWINYAIDEPAAGPTLALLAMLAGTVTFAPGLAGADVELDRTAAFAWSPRRTTHLVLVAAATVGLVSAADLTSESLAQTGTVIRNVAGLSGLMAFGAATLGAARAWILPGCWTLVGMLFTAPFAAPPAGPSYRVVLSWLVQPTSSGTATATAVTLGIAGALAYAFFGPRRYHS